MDGLLDFLRDWSNREHKRVRQRMGKRLGGGGEADDHRRRRNRPGKLAEAADSIDELHRFEEKLVRGEKRG
jgi:hypothetical protein